MTASPTADPGQKQEAALSRELSEFLLELSIGVHRHAMYPPGHPSLLPAAENLIGRLGEIFLSRATLSIGVAQDQLVIEGVATDSKHPVLSDLARRLHEHQLGAVSFVKGTSIIEVESLLGTLAGDAGREGEPLGLRPREETPRWEHIRLYPLGYDQLELRDGSGGGDLQQERATQLWLGLARAALATDEPLEEGTAPDPESIARSIQAHRREAAYDQVIVGYLLQLAEELKGGRSGEAEAVRKRLSTLIRELDQPTLQRLVDMGGNRNQRKKFVLDANQSLAVDSVVKVLKAAAEASEQSISTSLTRLLTKLSAHAELGSKLVRDQADTALRDNVEELLKDWSLEDPNPDSYTLILDGMAKAAPLFHATAEEEDGEFPGARRLVQMSLEVDTWGPTVMKAVWDLVDHGEVSYVLRLTEQAPPGPETAAAMRAFIINPSQLHRLLSGVDVDEEALRAIVARMGTAAIPTLLDALMDSESRSVRRKVFDVLASMGDEVGTGIMARLGDGRWYVLRNMLALVQRLPSPPVGFSAGPFMEHEDSRVRREAFPLAVRERPLRERTLAQGMTDSDERLQRMALLELQNGIPETLVPVLVRRVLESERASELKAMGVRALRSSRSTLALEALLNVTTSGKTILGRWKLAPSSLEALAALQVLAAQWRGEARVEEILSTALRSKDPEIARAASVVGAGG